MSKIDLDRLDVMLDIETWGTGTDAAVRAVALAVFKPWTGEVLASQVWDWRGLTDCQLELGRTVDAGTVRWWRTLPGAGLGEKLHGNDAPCRVDAPNTLEDAVEQLDGFLLGFNPVAYWSRGRFDYPILASLYAEMDTTAPWQYWQLRDVRTLDDLAHRSKPYCPHHPLSDCLAQVEQVRAALALVTQQEAA